MGGRERGREKRGCESVAQLSLKLTTDVVGSFEVSCWWTSEDRLEIIMGGKKCQRSFEMDDFFFGKLMRRKA